MHRIVYAHSGGVTSVINATAAAVIDEARRQPNVDHVLVAEDGILGILSERLLTTEHLNTQRLMQSPASAFGSCRYKLNDPQRQHDAYHRLFDVFNAHGIDTFIYNGGNDSQDTTFKVAQMAKQLGYPLRCIGVPKTIDNDLAVTDCCPGFGSAAKYLATSVMEATADVAAMAKTSTKVFVLEVMGRHAGWLAASCALAKQACGAPHMILLPEVAFDRERWLEGVRSCVKQHGYCVVVASEGLRNDDGALLSQTGEHDAFGHAQLGGVAPKLAGWVTEQLGLKVHWAVPDYLQRSARHLASQQDLEHAMQLGQAAVQHAVQGTDACMVGLKRIAHPTRWKVITIPLEHVANHEKVLPSSFITDNGWDITDEGLAYLKPLVQGEAYPNFQDGLPHYIDPTWDRATHRCPQRCPSFEP